MLAAVQGPGKLQDTVDTCSTARPSGGRKSLGRLVREEIGMRGTGFLAIWSDIEPNNLTDYRH
jgi:hypothetical protein